MHNVDLSGERDLIKSKTFCRGVMVAKLRTNYGDINELISFNGLEVTLTKMLI